jgi:hypothetical protein
VFKIFICTFNLSNQRLRRYTSGIIYAGSYGKTIFYFNFNTPDWDISPTKTAVFSYRGKNYQEPLDENNMCRVPEEVLHEGYFFVSVQDGQGLITNSIRVPVSPMPEELAPDVPGGGNCDCGPNVVYVPEVNERKILSWTLQEVTDDMPPIPSTDLNPSDEWRPTENEVVSEYIWEPMQ